MLSLHQLGLVFLVHVWLCLGCLLSKAHLLRSMRSRVTTQRLSRWQLLILTAPDTLRQTPVILMSQHMPLLGDYALQPVREGTQSRVLWLVLYVHI